MKEQTLPQSVIDCLTGWCLTEKLLSDEEREALIGAADYKKTRYAIVDDEKLEGLQKLGLLYITKGDDSNRHFLFRNGAYPWISMTKDFNEGSTILLCFRDKDEPEAIKMWDRYFKEDEFQPIYNGLVSLLCRAIAFRKPTSFLDDAGLPLSEGFREIDPKDPTDAIYLEHLQIASVQIYG